MATSRKKPGTNPSQERAFAAGNILSFLAGLSLGLLAALIVFLGCQMIGTETGGEGVASVAEPGQTQAGAGPAKPAFTFYDTLRNRQVEVSEWMLGERDDGKEEAAGEAPDEPGEPQEGAEKVAAQEPRPTPDREARDAITGYVLQAGSFGDFTAADQLKAQLALLGIFADVQRVMLNEQDIRHRVRLGPYASVGELQDVRRRLEENQIEFMVIELR